MNMCGNNDIYAYTVRNDFIQNKQSREEYM